MSDSTAVRTIPRTLGASVAVNKVRENRARRAAERQGLRLIKVRRLDRRALNYGTYLLEDMTTGTRVGHFHRGDFDLALDDVERFLAGER